MTTDKARYTEQLAQLVGRYKKGQINDGEEKEVVELVLRLDSQFPGDIGIWCAFVLNYVTLQRGEAMFLGAGEPHAYIAGGMYTYLLLLSNDRRGSDTFFQSAWNVWRTRTTLSVQD